jgi:hypothetical protein
MIVYITRWRREFFFIICRERDTFTVMTTFFDPDVRRLTIEFSKNAWDPGWSIPDQPREGDHTQFFVMRRR